jgi:hypothetical protein
MSFRAVSTANATEHGGWTFSKYARNPALINELAAAITITRFISIGERYRYFFYPSCQRLVFHFYSCIRRIGE